MTRSDDEIRAELKQLVEETAAADRSLGRHIRQLVTLGRRLRREAQIVRRNLS